MQECGEVTYELEVVQGRVLKADFEIESTKNTISAQLSDRKWIGSS